MGGLDADEKARKFLNHVGGGGGIHVICILLCRLGAHAAANDIEEGKDASFGAVNDAIFEVGKVFVTRAAGVGDGGDAAAEGEAVGIDAVVAIITINETCTGVDVSVNVDEAGRDVQAFGVDGLCGVSGEDVFFYGGDFAIANGYVTNFMDVVHGVKDGGVFDKQVVFFLSEERGRKKQQEQKSFHDRGRGILSNGLILAGKSIAERWRSVMGK